MSGLASNQINSSWRRVFERSGDVLRFKRRVVSKDLVAARTRRQQVQHVAYADAQAPQARATRALGRIDSNAMHLAHAAELNTHPQRRARPGDTLEHAS